MRAFLWYSWKYLRLAQKIKVCYDVYEETNCLNYDLLDGVLNYISECGSVATKLIQWITPILELVAVDESEFFKSDYSERKPRWMRRLENFYENCDEHSYEYTKACYLSEFNEELEDRYDIVSLLGSGSIGQVYLIRNKESEEKSVIKVLHPSVSEQIDIFEWWYKILFRYPRIQAIIRKIPVNLLDFVKSFRMQSDFISEANHILRMREIYRENEYIHIPAVQRVSKSVLQMEYLEGFQVEELKLKKTEEYKRFMIFYLFMRNNIICENYNHGDVHPGNWKLHPDKGITVYDFGFCWSFTKERRHVVEKTLDLFEGSNYVNKDKTIRGVADLIYELTIHDSIANKDFLKEEILAYVRNSPYVGGSDGGLTVSPISTIKILSGFCEDKDIYVDSYLIQFLILFVQMQKYCMIYGFTYSERRGIYPDVKVYKERYSDCLNFCQTYDIFPKYQKFVIEKLTELQITRSSIFDSITFSESIRSLAIQ